MGKLERWLETCSLLSSVDDKKISTLEGSSKVNNLNFKVTENVDDKGRTNQSLRAASELQTPATVEPILPLFLFQMLVGVDPCLRKKLLFI